MGNDLGPSFSAIRSLQALVFCGLSSGFLCGGALAADATAEDPAGTIEEILVTAQHRTEDLQKVPQAIAVLTAAQAISQGITDTRDIEMAVPGLQFQQQANGATPFIRGVGDPNGALGNEPSVATYVDDVYMANIISPIFSLHNISQVEVLKGPQGTLFGRNATGGVIKITTLDPSTTPSADIDVTAANYGTRAGTVYGTVGLGQDVAVNLSGYVNDQSRGWGTDLVTGEPAFTHRDAGFRSKLLWVLSDDTRFTLAGDYNRTRGEDALGLHLVPPSLGVDQVTRYNGFYNTYDDPNDNDEVRQGGASAKVEHHFSGIQVVDIVSWRKLNGFFRIDEDATPLNIVESPIKQHGKTVTEELRVLSEPGLRVPWIVGLYYLTDVSGYSPMRLLGAAALPFDGIDTNATQHSNSYAGFAQLTPALGVDSHLTLGFRYTVDQRSVSGSSTGFGENAAVLLSSAQQGARWNRPTWRLALDHSWSPDLMSYISYDRGFKSGVYNLLEYSQKPVSPERLDAYQIGTKSELLGNTLRLNASAFYYDYKNIQVDEIVEGAVLALNAAAATMKGVDLDIEYAPLPVLTFRAGLEVLDAHYTDFPNAPFNSPALNAAGLPTGGNISSSGDASGFDAVRAPKETGNATVSYRVPVRSSNLAVTVAYYYNSGYAWDPDNRLRQPAYSLVNTSLQWSGAGDRLGARLWAKNLTGSKICAYEAAISLGDICSPAAPLTFGITVFTHL
jgi:iron complex outermembrane receptor protein